MLKKNCLASCITVSIFSCILGGHVDWCGDYIFTCANGGVNIVQVNQKSPCFFSLNQCCESGSNWIRIQQLCGSGSPFPFWTQIKIHKLLKKHLQAEKNSPFLIQNLLHVPLFVVFKFKRINCFKNYFKFCFIIDKLSMWNDLDMDHNWTNFWIRIQM